MSAGVTSILYPLEREDDHAANPGDVKRMLWIGIDIGGTFTDFAVWRAVEDGYQQIVGQKIPTSRPDFSEAVIDGITQIVERLGVRPTDPILISHGTTVSTNAVIERSQPPVALLTTTGYRDILSIARLRLEKPIDIFNRRTVPLVPRGQVFEITERLRSDGSVETPLDEATVVAAVDKALEGGAKGIGICFLHSYRNSVHEARALEIIRERYPDLPAVASYEVWPQQSEYERAVATLLNVYVQPLMGEYLRKIDVFLSDRLPNARLFITKSNGGIMTSQEAQRLPIHTLLSGPAAGVTASQVVSGFEDVGDILTMDMGGTSTDLSLVQAGRSSVTAQAEVGEFPLILPVTAIEAMGAGAGSVIWMDAGVLKVGPRSAGSKPGPACYGIGGVEPTLTDAYLLCGYLSRTGLLGGRMPLSVELAQTALQPIADAAKLPIHAAAESCIAVATSNMLAKVLPFLARMGVEPSDLTLMVFGGAGGIHGPLLADEVGIGRIVVPRLSSVFCAFGCLVADLVQDHVRTVTGFQLDDDSLLAAFRELARQGRDWLDTQSFAGQVQEVETRYFAEMRYAAQSFTIPVDISGPVNRGAGSDEIRKAFDDEHQRLFGHCSPSAAVAINELRVRTLGRQAKPAAVPTVEEANGAADVAPMETRNLFIRGRFLKDCPVYDRAGLTQSWRAAGPAIVQHELSTVLVPPGYTARISALGDLYLTQAG